MEDHPNHWAKDAAALQALTDEQFLNAWHDCVCSNDKERLTLIEGNARHRFPVGDWREPYVSQFPQQRQYSLSK